MSTHINSRENGAALVIGLLLLLLITFLVVASMNNANVQERMAANSQNINLAFQAAESGIDEQVSQVESGDTAALNTALIQSHSATPNWPTDTYDAGDSDISTAVEIRHLGLISMGTGSSINADESAPKVAGARFEIRSASTIAGSGAHVGIVQGLEYR